MFERISALIEYGKYWWLAKTSKTSSFDWKTRQETKQNEKNRGGKQRPLILGLLIFILSFGVIWNVFAYTELYDSFDTYQVGQLLKDQPNWEGNNGGVISTDFSKSGSNSVKYYDGTANWITLLDEKLSSAYLSYWFRPQKIQEEFANAGGMGFQGGIIGQGTGNRLGAIDFMGNHKIFLWSGDPELGDFEFGDWSEGTWYYLTIELENDNIRYSIQGVYTDWLRNDMNADNVGTDHFSSWGGGNYTYYYLDDISFAGGYAPPLEAKIEIWEPESGSTIESLDEWFSFGYSGIDPEYFNMIFFDLWNESKTMILASRTFYTDPIMYWSIGESGEINYPIGTIFDFDTNGKYFLSIKGITYDFEVVLIDFTPSGYWFDLNVSELPEFEYTPLPPWIEWYGDNSVGGYGEPTGMFSAVANFVEPLYNTLGEFGIRIQAFLETGEAFAYGSSMGIVFPTFGHYINQIEYFFGGFPIIKIFIVSIILLLGIFIFRLILKFIPTLG